MFIQVARESPSQGKSRNIMRNQDRSQYLYVMWLLLLKALLEISELVPDKSGCRTCRCRRMRER